VRACTPKYLPLLEEICPATRFACPREACVRTKVEQQAWEPLLRKPRLFHFTRRDSLLHQDLDPSRLLKNAHLRRLSGPLTFSRACQELLLTRRNGTPHPSRVKHGEAYCGVPKVRLWLTHQLVGVARSRSLFVATPLSGFWAPRKRDFADSTCICLPARSRFGEGRDIFEQPAKNDFFSKPLDSSCKKNQHRVVY